MIEITAFGLLADHAESSIGFYRNTLGLERVLPIKNYGNQTLLRIESPRIELEQTCITIHDRPNCPYSGSRQRLKLLCDPATTITALSKIGIEVDDTLAFTDINGITWQLGDTQKRRLDS